MTHLVLLIVALVLYLVGTLIDVFPGVPHAGTIRHLGMCFFIASFLPLP